MALTQSQRDSIRRLTNADILNRIALGEAVMADGIRELAGAGAIKRVADQVQALRDELRYRDRKKNRKKPEGIVIGMKTLNLFARRP